MLPQVRKSLVFALAAGLLAFSTGCSRQGEGERCEFKKAGHGDCEDGLVCVPIGQADRCCRPDGSASDDRCDASRGNTGGSSGGGSPGNGGTSGEAGNPSGGTSGQATGGTSGNDSGGTSGGTDSTTAGAPSASDAGAGGTDAGGSDAGGAGSD